MTAISSMKLGLSVGVLGGGQLAKMLAVAALDMGLRPIVYCENDSDPAAQSCPERVFGSLKDQEALRHFFSRVEIVAFENEHTDCFTLQESAKSLNVHFFPALQALEKLQDKLSQKELLKSLGIPSPQFMPYDPGRTDVEGWAEEAQGRFADGCVFKWSRMGYDGHGVFISTKDHPRQQEAVSFCKRGLAKGAALYVEECVPFQRELAIVACHSRNGEFECYPIVLTEQRHGICFSVTGPARVWGFKDSLEKEAASWALDIARNAGLHGVFAIEFFETKEGRLLVNEIAPRVHNSGHFTQDGASTSQFENHWRCALGLSVGSVESAAGFTMLNLLGPEDAILRDRILERLPRDCHLHWYGKREMRPRRKMGHVNGAVNDPRKLPALLEEMKAFSRAWEGENS